jgi:uncharacterized lipoprotein YbaY
MRFPALSALLVSLIVVGSASAQTPQRVNIRGTVTAFDGKLISVQSRDAGAVQVALPDNVAVSGTKAITLADIKPGTPLGVTTIKRADGETVAIDVRPIPATAPLGLSPFDLAPGSTMTNATLEGQAISTSGSELVLNYKSGTIKVIVPPNTPMSQAVPGNRSDIKPGETIFIAALVGEDNKLTAARVQVSTNGVKPTQ